MILARFLESPLRRLKTLGMIKYRRTLDVRLFVSINDISAQSGNSAKFEFNGMHEHAKYFSNIVSFLKRDLINLETKILELKDITLHVNPEHRPHLYVTLKEADQFLFAENEAYNVYLCEKNKNEPVARIKSILDDITMKMNRAEYCAELVYEDHSVVINDSRPDDYYIKITPSLINFDRALNSIRESLTMDKFVLHPHNLGKDLINEMNSMSLDQDEKTDLDMSHLDGCNDSQRLAIKTAINNKLTIIQGPPGTGKTETCANLVAELLRRKNGRVLVCAASNIAVDNIAEKLNSKGLNVVRVYPRYISSEENPDMPDYALHKILDSKMTSYNCKELATLHTLITENKYQFSSQMNLYNEMVFAKEVEILKDADVICCSCVLSGSQLIRHFHYDAVLVDEASQPTEPETFIPLVSTTDKIILVGDHQQLGPVVNESYVDDAVRLTLFERLVKLGITPTLLDTQYRMHPALSEFSSREFYDGRIRNGVSAENRTHTNVTFKWPNPQIPMYFKETFGIEETPLDSKSHYNMIECNEVIKITTELINSGVPAKTIGIISPYSAQRNLISSKLNDHVKMNPSFSGIVVASVHAFQGREKDYIIISCVRSNDLKTVGFLVDPKQLNVAISRAKYGLIIVGNPYVLRNSPVWCDYLDYFKEKNLIVSGEYPNYRPAAART